MPLVFHVFIAVAVMVYLVAVMISCRRGCGPPVTGFIPGADASQLDVSYRCCFRCLVNLTVFSKLSLVSRKQSAMLSGTPYTASASLLISSNNHVISYHIISYHSYHIIHIISFISYHSYHITS